MEFIMSNQEFFLGIDISTTGAKSLLMDVHGKVTGSASTPLAVSSPYPLWSEQNPQDWWEGISVSIKQLLQTQNIKGEQIKAIGLTGQMHGLVLLDKEGMVLRPAILWNDQRTGEQCDMIRMLIGREKLIQITGNDALTGFTAPKILWVKQNEPFLFEKARHFLLPKDYVRYRLTGEFAMDKADGSGTILFDLKKRDWSFEIIEELGFPPFLFPPVYEGTDVTGVVSQEAASQTDLAAGTPVVAGGGDQSAQAVGVGVVAPGIIALTLGTSGVIFAATSSPSIEPEGRLHAFCHALPGHWHLMGVMLSAAGSLQWHRDSLAADISFDQLLKPASQVPAGSEGLFFLPYLTGERTPYPDPLARACWIGLTVRHSVPHMTRSVLEGVAYGLRDSFELMRNAGLGNISQVRISGGGSKSELWRKILASVLNTELVRVNTIEGAAYGAALLAGVNCGAWPDVPTACKEVIQITGQDLPDPGLVDIYESSYRIYTGLYPVLKNSFQRIGKQ
jgi:xylulokinase